MPHPTKQFEIDAVPEPELNPVLNPLLAAHMGRWAEVYFTTLPEKREQAVSQLLQDLQNGYFSEPTSLQVIDAATSEKEVADEEAPDASPPVAEAVPIFGACSSEPELFLGGNSPEYSVGEPNPIAARGDHDDREAAGPQPVPYRYWIYVGVTLAIILAFLLYMAWRDTKAIARVAGTQSSLSRTIPAAASTAPARTRTSSGASLGANGPTSAVRNKNQVSASSQKNKPASPSSPVASSKESYSVVTAEQNGAEEWATAKRYLNGTPRDSAAAAQWLWTAVGKRNLAATMALSDLYLRGDGVPRSCDQARLLLDAAARKGGAGAGERLRNLQAFGCR